MSNLSATRFKRCVSEDGLELWIRHDGAVFATQRGLSRMCGHADDTKIRRWKAASNISVLEAEIPTAGGVQGASLFDEAAIHQAFAEFNAELLLKCSMGGLRVFLYALAGVQFNPLPDVSTPSLPSTEQRLAALIDVLERAKSIGFDPSDPRSAHSVNEQVARILLSDSPISPVGPANTVTSTGSRSEPMPLIVNLEKHMSARELAKIWTGRGGRTLTKRAHYVNKRLLRSGFQWRNTISGLWHPTVKAAPYVKAADGQLLWLPTVLSNFKLNARTTQRK